jgi:hypothetical protein
MLHASQTTRFFILCTSFAIATPTLPGMAPAAPNPAVETDQQIKERAVLFEKLLKSFDQAIIKVKNNLSLAIQFTKKYGRDIDKDAITKKMFEANDALDRFLQMKIRSVQQYFQQDPTTIPAEGYQEIYETIDSVVHAALKLVQELDTHIQSNFTEEFNFDFLISKNNLSLTEENIAPEMIFTRCTELDAAAETLFESSNAIGLTLYNKTCRTIDKYVVRPCAKYHALEALGIGGFLTFAFAYTYWMSYCPRLYSKQEETDMARTLEHIKELLEQSEGKATTYAEERWVKDLKESAEKLAKQISGDNIKRQEKELDWLARLLIKFFGKPPVRLPDGTLSLGEIPEDQRTYWNRLTTFAHNSLVQAPIQGVIQTGVAALFGSYLKPVIWPRIKMSVQSWWQKSLGGRHLEMQQQGSFECGIEWTFDQVIGLDHIKARFEPALAYAEDPVKHATIGAHVATNYIFYGVKRTGKSFFAVALAGEMKKRNPNMRILKIPSQIFHHLGVKEAIDLIRSYAPCVVFIDEIDIAGFSRAMDRNTTGELLKELGNGNISPSPDRPVFLLFATNKLEAIDTSLTSMGRFGPSVLFTTPLFIDRIQFVDAILRTNGHNADNFDVYRLAERTEGNSFEDIKYCISEAILRAGTYNIPLTTELIMNVMDEILNGIYPEYPGELDPAALKVVATHYAGKALISMLMPSHERLDTVTIRKRKLPLLEDEHAGFSGKPTYQRKYEYGMLITRQATSVGGGSASDRMLMTPELQKAHYMRIFAGSVAEELVLGMANNACDELQIIYAYQNLICQCSDGGLAYYLKQWMSNEQQGEYFAKARVMVDGYKQEIRELLTKHRRALDVLARALMSPALGGSITDGIVSMIIENPEGVSEQLDIAEAEMKKQYEDRMKKQQEEYDRMMAENTVVVDQSPDATETIAEPIAQENAEEPIQEAA